MTDQLAEKISTALFGKLNKTRLADIAALVEPLQDAHYLVVGENGTLRSEVERLKAAQIAGDRMTVAVERATISKQQSFAEGMERAAVIFDGDGSKMVSRAWAAAAIRAEVKHG